jgi:thiamine biosynthesis lipoprotein
MGTTYTVRVAAESTEAASVARLEDSIDAAISSVDDHMTTYRESEVTRFNAWRSAEPFEVSPDTREVVALALDLAARTEGALDVTIAPLVAAFGFGPSMPAGLPAQESLDDLLPRVGYSLLRVDAEGRLLKGHPELEIDLSAVAKGYAVDRAATALDGQGVTDYMVEIGGEVRARGRNERDEVWRIGVERPDSALRTIQRIVPLPDMAMATSGDYRQYREIEGTRISHIIDPRTARPIDHGVASATVLHPSCASADGLATAMMVLGEEGLHLAEENGWAVLLLVRSPDGFREEASSAFAALIESDERSGA